MRVQGASAAPLAWKKDFVMWSMRNDSLVTARGDVVFAGYGIVAPEYGWNDYAGLDAKGKIVVVLVNDPGLQDSTIFRGKILTYYGRWTYKIEEAQRQGAAGLLMVHTTESASYPWTTVLSGWVGPQVRLEREPGSLVVAGWLQQDAAARLFAQGGQDLAALTAAAARKGFRSVPLKLQLDASVRSAIRRSETENVLGRWPGKGQLAHEAVLIGGHYDHFGIGAPVNGDSIYNGAEDNASGTAGVLATAEAFVRSGVHAVRSMVFIAFAAEESGLLGSQALAATPPFPLKRHGCHPQRGRPEHLRPDPRLLGPWSRSILTGRRHEPGRRGRGAQGDYQPGGSAPGRLLPLGPLLAGQGRRPGTSLESGSDYVGRPAGWGQEQHDKYNDRALPPAERPGSTMVQLRRSVATASRHRQDSIDRWQCGRTA